MGKVTLAIFCSLALLTSLGACGRKSPPQIPKPAESQRVPAPIS